jgi:predicted PurR-regulated permease PerM
MTTSPKSRAKAHGDAAEGVPTPTVSHTSVLVRSNAIVVLALISIVVFLHWAQAVIIPITFSVFMSYALTPVVNWLKRRARLPKAIGAAATLLLILGAVGWGLNSLQSQALDVLDIVPRATEKFSLALRGNPREPEGAVEKMKKAATEIEKAANTAGTTTTTTTTPTTTTTTTRNASIAPRPAPEAPTSTFKVRDYVLMGTASLIAGMGQLVVIVALVYFLLVAGDSFRRTLIRISGDSLGKKKITVQILDEIDLQIQRYLLVQLLTSVLLAFLTWIAFAWIGLHDALFWACLAGMLHLIPYAGPTALVAITTLVAYVQFDTLQPVAMIIGVMLALLGIIGLLLVPWLTQRVGKINAVIVFVSLLFWGWLWGVWGLLLGVPIVMAIKAVCERVEDLRPISEFLGYEDSPATQIDDVADDRKSEIAARDTDEVAAADSHAE